MGGEIILIQPNVLVDSAREVFVMSRLADEHTVFAAPEVRDREIPYLVVATILEETTHVKMVRLADVNTRHTSGREEFGEFPFEEPMPRLVLWRLLAITLKVFLGCG